MRGERRRAGVLLGGRFATLWVERRSLGGGGGGRWGKRQRRSEAAAVGGCGGGCGAVAGWSPGSRGASGPADIFLPKSIPFLIFVAGTLEASLPFAPL
jgi:hypothetical protein